MLYSPYAPHQGAKRKSCLRKQVTIGLRLPGSFASARSRGAPRGGSAPLPCPSSWGRQRFSSRWGNKGTPGTRMLQAQVASSKLLHAPAGNLGQAGGGPERQQDKHGSAESALGQGEPGLEAGAEIIEAELTRAEPCRARRRGDAPRGWPGAAGQGQSRAGAKVEVRRHGAARGSVQGSLPPGS